MVERLFLAVLIVGGAVTIWHLYNRRTIRRLGDQLITAPPDDPLLSGLPTLSANTPTILYFTTPYCAPCRTQQAPTLTQLQAEKGDALQVIHIDCEQQPEVADRWGVFSTPTTFVLNRDHQPVAVNRGLASAGTLKTQLAG